VSTGGRLLVLGVIVAGALKLAFAPNVIRAELPHALRYREQVVGSGASGSGTSGSGTSGRLPMLIVLHGAGADEKDLDGVFEDFQTPLRVVSFRAPVRSGGGYVWAYGRAENAREARRVHDAMFGEVAASLAGSVPELVGRYPTRGRPYVFGFSQGAAMAFYLGVHHPDVFAGIFAAAGQLAPEMLPDQVNDRLPPFFVYHGKQDRVVALHHGRRTAEAIQALSGEVAFLEHSGGHRVAREVREDLERRIAAASR
jgi:phospholipase/carboxylesterase